MTSINKEIADWIQYDNKIKEYSDKSKKLRTERDKLGKYMVDSIEDIDNLPTYNILPLNTSLTFQNSKTYENYTNQFYMDCFTEYLGSGEKATELLEFMKQRRAVSSKITLKQSYLMDM